MVLTVLNPELWLFGFIGTVYTKNYAFASLIVLFYWCGMTYIGRHITDPFELQIVVHGENLISHFFGIVTGLAFNLFIRQYTLVDTYVTDKRNQDVRPGVFLLLTGTLLLGGAFYLLDGSFTELEERALSESESFTYGFAMVLVGAFIVLCSVGWMLFYDRRERLNLKYLLWAGVLSATPALVDYFLFIESYRPWQILNFVVAWILLTAIGYAVFYYINKEEDNYWAPLTDAYVVREYVRKNHHIIKNYGDEKCAIEQIVAIRQKQKWWEILRFQIAQFLVVITTYTTAIILDEIYGNECTSTDCAMVEVVRYTFIAVGAWSAFWTLLFIGLRYFSCPYPVATLKSVEGEIKHYGELSMRYFADKWSFWCSDRHVSTENYRYRKVPDKQC